MKSIDDYLHFHAVAQHRGFGAAARELGIGKASLSRRVRALEDRLGVRLIERSTHRFEITDAGRILLAHCQTAIAELETAEAAALSLTSEPRGTLRIATLPGMPAEAIADMLPVFLAAHPKVRVELLVGVRRVDLIEERVDVAFRVRAHLDSDVELIVKRLGRFAAGLVAAPAVLERHGRPESPDELAALPTVGLEGAGPSGALELTRADGVRVTVRHHPVVVSNDLEVRLRLVLGGVGIGLLPDFLTGRHLAEGTLVRVLPDWRADEGIFHLVFPSRRGMLPAVRAFIDAVSQAIQTVLKTEQFADERRQPRGEADGDRGMS